jgi:serine/threonine protein kinase
MEIVEGETLNDRIARGPLPVDEAVKVARQVTEAVEPPMKKEFIHRDLEATNIKLTPDAAP